MGYVPQTRMLNLCYMYCLYHIPSAVELCLSDHVPRMTIENVKLAHHCTWDAVQMQGIVIPTSVLFLEGFAPGPATIVIVF